MQQQEMEYDLLAVFSSQSDADNAESKLHKENYGDDEVFRLAASTVVGGQFREHGPDRDRSSVFLQTTRQGPNPTLIILFAIVFGLLLGGVNVWPSRIRNTITPYTFSYIGRHCSWCHTRCNSRAAAQGTGTRSNWSGLVESERTC